MARFYPPGVPKSIEYPVMPLYSFLENSARKFPNRTGAFYLDNGISYAELWEKALRFVRHIKLLGVESGDRVGLILPNTPQFIIAFNGILAAGGVVVAINPLNSVDEIRRETAETECKVLVVLDRLIEKLPVAYSGMVVVADAAEFAPIHLRLLSNIEYRVTLPKNALKFENMTTGEQAKPVVVTPKDDLAAILYTSGTTGLPKGVMMTHYSLTANALQSYYWLRGWGYSLKPQPAGWPMVLCAVPFFHSYGMNILNEAISFGCSLVLIPDPKAELILEATQRHRITHLPLIPRFVSEILDYPRLGDYDLSSVTTASSGGASISPDMMRRFEEIINANFYQGYGLTEAGPATHATPIMGKRNYLSAGMAYPDTEVKVVDTQVNDVEVPLGGVGELLIRGPQVMKGYWNAPEDTSRVLVNGWLHTGDIVRVDEDGWLYVVGRKIERIVATGRTVWPTEIEDVLTSSPEVDKAVVYGTPDPLRCDTTIQSFVVLKRGYDPEGAEVRLMQLCSERLQFYQIPGRIEVVESLPLTIMGKVDRAALDVEIERRLQRAMDNYAKENPPYKS